MIQIIFYRSDLYHIYFEIDSKVCLPKFDWYRKRASDEIVSSVIHNKHRAYEFAIGHPKKDVK